ncbi:MAG: Holliday junction branch migration protein RuvA [Microbacteriaceae bacterium]
MISSLRGTVLSAAGSLVVIEVGGVGLAVQVTPAHALSLRVGAEAMLRTALIVREDDLSLFGFADADELDVFDKLRSVTGVGPKSAMGVLAAMTPGQVADAVATEDDAAFRKVSGIGPKTAKLIVLSLTGKLAVLPQSAPAPSGANSITENVLVALVGLGWPERVAAQALDDAVAQASDAEKAGVSSLLRVALAQLGPAMTNTRDGGDRA